MAIAAPLQARTVLAKQLGGVEVEVAWMDLEDPGRGRGPAVPTTRRKPSGSADGGEGRGRGGPDHLWWTVSSTAAFAKFS